MHSIFPSKKEYPYNAADKEMCKEEGIRDSSRVSTQKIIILSLSPTCAAATKQVLGAPGAHSMALYTARYRSPNHTKTSRHGHPHCLLQVCSQLSLPHVTPQYHSYQPHPSPSYRQNILPCLKARKQS